MKKKEEDKDQFSFLVFLVFSSFKILEEEVCFLFLSFFFPRRFVFLVIVNSRRRILVFLSFSLLCFPFFLFL
jgi:hypothetical protein